MSEHDLKTASLTSELHDRIAENRQLRQELDRALRLIERGDMESATTLLRRLAGGTTT